MNLSNYQRHQVDPDRSKGLLGKLRRVKENCVVNGRWKVGTSHYNTARFNKWLFSKLSSKGVNLCNNSDGGGYGRNKEL